MSSTTVEEILREGIRLARTQERLFALLAPMEMQAAQIDVILKDAPELGPEMNAVRARLGESVDHLRSASMVLEAKVELL
jgi:hypothetical protein